MKMTLWNYFFNSIKSNNGNKSFHFENDYFISAGQQNNNVENSFDGERMVVEVLNPA
jgi:hypothetical protein